MDMHFPVTSSAELAAAAIAAEPFEAPVAVAVPTPYQRGRAAHDARWHACGYDQEHIVAAELTEARDILAQFHDRLVAAGLRSEWPGRGITVEDILADVESLREQVGSQLAGLAETFADLARDYDGGGADDRRDAMIGEAMVFGRGGV